MLVRNSRVIPIVIGKFFVNVFIACPFTNIGGLYGHSF